MAEARDTQAIHLAGQVSARRRSSKAGAVWAVQPGWRECRYASMPDPTMHQARRQDRKRNGSAAPDSSRCTGESLAPKPKACQAKAAKWVEVLRSEWR